MSDDPFLTIRASGLIAKHPRNLLTRGLTVLTVAWPATMFSPEPAAAQNWVPFAGAAAGAFISGLMGHPRARRAAPRTHRSVAVSGGRQQHIAHAAASKRHHEADGERQKPSQAAADGVVPAGAVSPVVTPPPTGPVQLPVVATTPVEITGPTGGSLY